MRDENERDSKKMKRKTAPSGKANSAKSKVKLSSKDKDKGKKNQSAHSTDCAEDDKKNSSGGCKNTSEIKRNEKAQLVFKDYPEFIPNMTPKEVLQAGSFGGTYFRPIYSSITSMSHCGQKLSASIIAQQTL